MLDYSLANKVFEGDDPYAVSHYVNKHIGEHDLTLMMRPQHSASLYHCQFDLLDICRIRYGLKAKVTSPALENIYHLQILLKGFCIWRINNAEIVLGAGQLLLINPDDPVDLTYSEDCEKLIVKIPKKVFEQICFQQNWLIRKNISFLPQFYVSENLQDIFALLVLICREASNQQIGICIQKSYINILAYKLLTLLKNNIQFHSNNDRTKLLEQLINYIANNLMEDIKVEDLAEFAKVSQRVIYDLFTRHLQMPPKRYIQQQKLMAIHTKLVDPNCAVSSVSSLAMDYGFFHLGRFATNYQRQYGEKPSETLRQRYLH